MSTSSIPSVSSAPKIDRSALFVQFNRARSRRAGLERGRVNRALGLVQSGKVRLEIDGSTLAGTADEPYNVTSHGCTCRDYLYRVSRDRKAHGTACKHMIARWLLIRMQKAQPQPAPTRREDAVYETRPADLSDEGLFGTDPARVSKPAPSLETLAAALWGAS